MQPLSTKLRNLLRLRAVVCGKTPIFPLTGLLTVENWAIIEVVSSYDREL